MYLLLKVKRTSLWNKACEELRKHQEFIAKVQQNPEFLKEPFGDPFSGEDLKAQLGGGDDSEDSDSENDSMMNQDEIGLSSSVGKSKQRQSLPFYSDGEEDDTDDDFTESSKSQKLDLKKHKSQNLSNSMANGGSISQKTPLAVATKTLPPSTTSPLISPRNLDKKEEKLSNNKKLSKKKQKELHHQQQLLLAEAAAKANESSNEALNGSSLKKKRGRPKKNKSEEPDGDSPNPSSQNSLVSSQVSSLV